MPVILPQSVVIPWITLPQIIVFYYKIIVVYHEKIIYTTKCDILQQCVIFTTERGNSIILPQIVLFYYKI